MQTTTSFWDENINSHIKNILANRGIENGRDAYYFLFPDRWMIESPFRFKSMNQALKLFSEGVEGKKKVGIFADTDVDGVTSLSLLHEYLREHSVVPVMRYPLGRDGYGLTREVIDDFAAQGVELLITVDSGIADVDEIAYGRSRGMDVLVTDHHQCAETLPDAVILNPFHPDETFDFPNYAGVTVALKLVMGHILQANREYKDIYGIVTFENEEFSLSIVDAMVVVESCHCSSLEEVESVLEKYPQSLILTGNIEKGTLKAESRPLDEYIGTEGDALFISTARENGIKRPEWLNLHERSVALLRSFHVGRDEELNRWLDILLPLAALGTVADVMPLILENRNIVSCGLNTMDQYHNGLFRKLLKDNRGNEFTSSIDESALAWNLSPLFNTPGRFGMANLTVELMLQDDNGQQEKLINEIQELNSRRRSIMKDVVDRLKSDPQSFNSNGNEYNDLEHCTMVVLNDVPEGLSGLIAGRVAELFKKPAIVIIPDGSGFARGSGRVASHINLFEHVIAFAHLFEKIGGHDKAFGFTIPMDNIDTLITLLDESLSREEDETGKSGSVSEIQCFGGELTEGFLSQFEYLKPFGKDNSNPVFDVTLSNTFGVQTFGEKKKHWKCYSGEKNSVEFIGWSMGESIPVKISSPITVRGTLGKNQYRGKNTPRFTISERLS